MKVASMMMRMHYNEVIMNVLLAEFPHTMPVTDPAAKP
jgi:hypothetical protein